MLTSNSIVVRINEEVIIRLKWGQTEYKGQLISVDSYMNVQLNGTEEFINGKSTGTLGQVLIRYAATHILLRFRTPAHRRLDINRSRKKDQADRCRSDAITSCGSRQPRVWR